MTEIGMPFREWKNVFKFPIFWKITFLKAAIKMNRKGCSKFMGTGFERSRPADEERIRFNRRKTSNSDTKK